MSRERARSGSKKPNHKWRFKARFRRHAFGWRSAPAITRIAEALSEIKQPGFAIEVGVLALHWMARGYGYEITAEDVMTAWNGAMAAAGHLNLADETRIRMLGTIDTGSHGRELRAIVNLWDDPSRPPSMGKSGPSQFRFKRGKRW